MSTAIVRTAVPADAAAIARVHVLGWQVAYRDLLPGEFLDALSVEQRSERWSRRLAEAAPHEHVLVADADGSLLGFASVGASRDDDAGADVGELAALYLDPAWWRHGIGRRLQRSALDALAGDGFRTATLWVLASNERATSFYENTGWAPDGASKSEPHGDVVLHELRYHRPLHAGS